MMAEARPRWRCPECGRDFAHPNQWHSCLRTSVVSHFKGKDPRLEAVYRQLINRLEAFGPVSIDAVKHSIILGSRAHFAAVYPYQQHLLLEFLSDQAISSPRFQRVQQLGGTRVSHFIKLSGPVDIDEELLNWLAKSYWMQSQP